MNESLRTLVAANLGPVRPLQSPLRRVLPMVPMGLALLLAAPLVFSFRDLAALGWWLSWGASTGEMIVGFAVIVLALEEAIPGRMHRARLHIVVVTCIASLIAAITMTSWQASPVRLSEHWWTVAAICAACSATTALPAVVLSAVLIVNAYPVRPRLTGALGGLGAGLMADAGWRLFCHYSEPAHVVVAHAGGLALAAVAGLAITSWLARRAMWTTPDTPLGKSSRNRWCR
jgi:hypothetical protein